MRSAFAAATVLLASCFSTGTARADWPMARHGATRTAVANGASNIQTPEVAWSTYLGGSLGGNQLLAADVEGNGTHDFIRASAGTVAAIRTDGSTVWTVRTSGVAYLLGLTDLNGDGKQEVIAYTGGGALALDLATGVIVWQQPHGEMGAVSQIRMSDMTGDGLADLAIGECTGCEGGKVQTGFFYSFASGFTAPLRVALPMYTALGEESALANLDGMGGDELLGLFDGTKLAAIDPATGAVLASSADLGLGNALVAGCLRAPLDPGGPESVICVLSPGDAPTPGPTDTTRVFALSLALGNPSTLVQRWSYSLEPSAAISNAQVDLVADLAGDGTYQTLVTAYDANGTPTVHVLDAATGAEVASAPGVLDGTAPMAKGRVLLVQQASSIDLYGFVNGSLASLGSIKGDSAFAAIDWTRAAESFCDIYRPVSFDVNDDGSLDVIGVVHKTSELLVYTPGTVPPPQIGVVMSKPGDPIANAWPLLAMDRPYPQIGVLANDGLVRLLDKTLAFTGTSIKVGGYYEDGGYPGLGTSPIVSSFGKGLPAQVLATSSLHQLVRFDASNATSTSAPTAVWQLDNLTSPVIVPGLDGDAAGVFALLVDVTASPPTYSLVRTKADGTVVWQDALPGVAREDVVPGDFDGDGVPDVAVVANQGPQMSTVFAFSGASGAMLWSKPLSGCGQEQGLSVFDWNGDGVDDVALQVAPTYVLSGADGSLLAMGGPSDCFFLPIPVDIDGDGTDEIVFASGDAPEQVWSHDLQTMLFVGTQSDQPFPYGAIATCDDGPALVEGSSAFPSQLKITKLGKGVLGNATTIFLEQGMAYPDQASADMVGNSQLTAINVHPNLTGSGKPTAVVGSTDGWLYAVDACSGQIAFTYDFGEPVGEPIFGDTDGDGLDEILVEVDDGNLYALRQKTSTGTGGAGGSAGAGGADAGPPPHDAGADGGPWYPIYGRGGCCGVAGSGAASDPALLAFAVGLLAAGARRRRSRC